MTSLIMLMVVALRIYIYYICIYNETDVLEFAFIRHQVVYIYMCIENALCMRNNIKCSVQCVAITVFIAVVWLIF